MGPQGAGKTTFCREIIRQRPDISLIERDAILLELFGPRGFNHYCGHFQVLHEVMWGRVKDMLAKFPEQTLILDAWLGFPNHRHHAGRTLRSFGVDQIDLWYFVTDIETCVRQYVMREAQASDTSWQLESRERCCRRNFQLFHSMPIEDDDQESSFDTIRFINPQQTTFIPYAQLILP